jgi:hypothetical protein
MLNGAPASDKPKLLQPCQRLPGRALADTRDRGLSSRLSADRHADGLAPLADAGIADAVNGAVGPFRGRGRKRRGVGVGQICLRYAVAMRYHTGVLGGTRDWVLIPSVLAPSRNSPVLPGSTKRLAEC